MGQRRVGKVKLPQVVEHSCALGLVKLVCTEEAPAMIQHPGARPNREGFDMPKPTCKIPGCILRVTARSMCRKHYAAANRNGEIPKRPDPIDRFWSKVDKTETCWLWTGSVDTHGYGKILLYKKTQLAHRVSYELSTKSTLTSETLIDHTCHVTRCVNPRHLRVATRGQNNAHRKGATIESSSGYRNVYKIDSGYLVKVSRNGKVHHVGCFAGLNEAVEAAADARLRLFGSFAGGA